MNDFTIGLDLDGVCYQWDRTARYMLRRRIESRGANPPSELDQPSTYWNAIQEEVGPDDWNWLWTDAIGEGLYRYGNIVTGAIEGVQALNALGEVVAITARPKTAVHDTLAWLSFMFDKAPLSGVVIQSNGQKKSEVIPSPDVYIDDAAHNVYDILHNTNSKVILYDAPYNQGVPYGPRLARAHGWAEVVYAAQKIKEAYI